jgi:hypothetical protein
MNPCTFVDSGPLASGWWVHMAGLCHISDLLRIFGELLDYSVRVVLS